MSPVPTPASRNSSTMAVFEPKDESAEPAVVYKGKKKDLAFWCGESGAASDRMSADAPAQ